MDEEDPCNGSQYAESSTAAWPTAPVYDFTARPSEISNLDVNKLPSDIPRNFFRSARWCADGTAILATAEDRVIRVYETPLDGNTVRMDTGQAFTEPDAIHAATWYPSATASSPQTFCFMASIRDGPVRLIDATDGQIRATYSIVDHRERFVAPYAFAFNPSATKQNAIEVLELANPGVGYSERLKTSFSRNEKGGQKGIISALAFCLDQSGTFAAGSFSGSVSVYSEDTGATPIQHLEGVKGGGVTQVAFHPLSPTTLFVASRRSHHIQVFDLRDGSAPFAELSLRGDTNQRLGFDIDPWGRYLASGDSDGTVKVWNIQDLRNVEPIFEKRLHEGAVGSVQLHPYRPFLLSVSGSRSYTNTSIQSDAYDSSDDSDDDDDDEDSDIADQEDLEQSSAISPQRLQDPRTDSTVRIWSFASPIATTAP